ncbi:single-stranded DNA-binding protein [Candidatus Gracilibacteria bacterium]|nr:single-stranded DNA-binding protein [Candidatus Gracilibacteria bacterium]
MSLNRVQIIGNLTRDPEMKQIPGGQVVVNFSVATNATWTDKDGNKQEKVEFHNIVAWRKLAEIIGQYLKKGSKVFVEGKLQTRSWEGEDGVKRYRTEIVAENMIMLDSKGAAVSDRVPAGITAEQAPMPDAAPAAPVAAAGGAPAEAKKEEVTIDDLPF